MKQTFPVRIAHDKETGRKKLEFPPPLRHFLSQIKVGEEITLTVNSRRAKRTDKQNAAIHLWFTLLADELNERGYTVQMVLKQNIDLDWNGSLVKELLWRPAQKKILNKESTTDLNKLEEIDLIFDHLNRHIGEKFQIHIPFPQDEEYQLLKVRY